MATQVGLKDLHIAVLKKDDKTGVEYETPVLIAGAINAKIQPKSNTETLYADDGPAETATALGEIEVEIEVKDLPLAVQGILFGHKIQNGVMIKSADDVAPYVALGFRSKMSNGKYRYIWLYKGRFELPEQEYKTQEDKPAFQTPKAKGVFVKREFDNLYQVVGDEDETGFAAGDTWFNQVYERVVDTTAPTVTVSPTDGETGVLGGSNITWTFSKEMNIATVNAANFIVMTADGTTVNGTLSLDATKKIVTFDPAANLSAATDYIAIATTNVKDINGNSLAQNSVTNFTTA
ncbi:major tail protein [Aneurinibacillus thermoaerophilus]|uniref:major tail protein n=1 Tax=Aneurinibacillus thermoaerophilus TaxID=143495 RepID=UPI002E232502|nr:major tail protein [Aneurinibacillus thermoaerophilus]MED0676986.1 Ig-like domain-containing protein [Aneurinibacillus thermoaerophilus]